jgi:glycosyltransferase involved in cell wall biosynthesis
MVHKSKLVFVITDLGSFENFISEQCVFLTQHYQVDISVICSKNKVINFEDKFLDQNESIRFFFVDIPRGFNIFKHLIASRKINKIIQLIQPDLIHAHFTTSIFTTILLKNTSAEIWGTFHGLGFVVTKGFKKKIFYLVESLCFSRLNRIILLNKEDVESIPLAYSQKVIKQKSLGLGCDLSLFDRSKYNDEYIMNQKIKYSAVNSFVMAFTGRFVSFKGFDIVVRTFLQLEKRFPGKFKLMLIGGIDPAHKTGLTSKEEEIIFDHNGVINIGFTNKVHDYLIIADLFFFPSIKEGIPICITEALAMGVPALTFNSRGCNQLIINLQNGYLVNPSNDNNQIEKEFFDHIIHLYENPSLLAKFSETALRKRNRLSRENFIIENTEWYKKKLLFKDE